MADRGPATPWPDPPPGWKASPGTRAWAVLRRLRAGGWLRPRRIGCLLVVLLVVLLTVLWVVGSAINGITAVFRNEPGAVQGGPFPTATPTSAPGGEPAGVDLINDGKLIVAVPEGFGRGERAPGADDHAGFDLALLDAIAQEVGAHTVSTDKRVPTKTRTYLLAGRVKQADLGLFEITPELHREVDIVGPYLVSDLRLAVPPDSAVRGPDSLGDGGVCAPKDSPAATVLANRLGAERVVTRAHLGDCVRLLGTRVSAIAADEIALRALPALATGELRMVGEPLGTTEYGIGLPPGDPALRAQVVSALRKAVGSGAWRQLYEQHFGPPAPTPPVIR